MLELEGIILVLWQSPQVAVMCAGHSAVMKTLTSVDALCTVFVSIPDGLPFSSLLSNSEVDVSDTFVMGCFLVPFILLC